MSNIMGNLCGRQLENASHSPNAARTTDPGTSKSCSNEGQFSGFAAESSSLDGHILPYSNLRIFSLAEVESATGNFQTDSVAGEGWFGRNFKGWIDEKTLEPSKVGSGITVAVKKLNSASLWGWEKWRSEVNFLGTLSHPNIVKLLGYCWENNELLLVYEFMENGSLENHLFRRGPAHQLLSWSTRIKIALGAARGLAFLHTSGKPVIYRDFKASNILLDMNYNAKVFDFGLAKDGPMGENAQIATRTMSTFGFQSPIYVAKGNQFMKSDVYGFGVVLLEILTGQKALDRDSPSEEDIVVERAKRQLPNRRELQNIMDKRLNGQYSLEGALQAAELTLKCLGSDPRTRPSLKEVVETLELIEDIKLPRK